MFVVYVLFSSRYNQIYIGYTRDLIDRFKSHNELGTKGHTIKYRPWMVVLVEFYDTQSEAMRREKQLKAGQGRAYIRNQVIPRFR